MTKINITEANETSKFGEGLFNGAAEHEDVNYGDKLSRAVEKKCKHVLAISHALSTRARPGRTQGRECLIYVL